MSSVPQKLNRAALADSTDAPSKPLIPLGPTTTVDALKWIGGGAIALGLGIACLYVGDLIGIIPIWAIGCALCAGPMGILYGITTLVLPPSMRGSKTHNGINGVIFFSSIAALLAGGAWYLIR